VLPQAAFFYGLVYWVREGGLAFTSTQNTAHHATHNLAAYGGADVAHSRLDHDLRQALVLTATWACGAE